MQVGKENTDENSTFDDTIKNNNKLGKLQLSYKTTFGHMPSEVSKLA